MDQSARVSKVFREEFGEPPASVARAPGRVNLIGEHTDYNDGYCLPMAIDRALWLAFRPRPDRRVAVRSLEMAEGATLELDGLVRGEGGWGRYVSGVAWALQQNGYRLAGWEGVLGSDIPVGSGLSSSAALELAVTRVFAAVSGFVWEPRRMAQIGQQVENGWLGLQTGIMDQLVIANGVAGHALLLDCRSLSLRPAPLPPDTAVVVMDTRTPRELMHSGYNQRRAECEAAARQLGVPSLRDAGPAALAKLPPTLRQRARHIVSENRRTLAATDAMERGDASELGRLMNASHDSLRDDYEVSSATLDAMVASARRQPGCLGARMIGAGFGGCAIALVRRPDADAFMEQVAREYARATGLTPNLFIGRPADGVSLTGAA